MEGQKERPEWLQHASCMRGSAATVGGLGAAGREAMDGVDMRESRLVVAGAAGLSRASRQCARSRWDVGPATPSPARHGTHPPALCVQGGFDGRS